MLQATLQVLALVGLLAASTSAQTLIDKPPDLGLAHEPFSNSGVFVYADSFIAPTGDTVVTELGTWLIPLFGPGATVVAFQVWGEDPNTGGPNWKDVIASTDDFSTETAGLNLHTLPVKHGGGPLTPGLRYWFVATAVGRQGTGGYGLGGHTQNSVVQDNGTIWWSDDPSGQSFNFQNQLPEMAFQVRLAPTVPALSTMATLVMALVLIIAASKILHRKKAAIPE